MKPDGVVIDVGANDGKEAVMLAQAGFFVYSFEPTPGELISLLF